ncbi:MAG: hypothetical protein QOF66_5118 [Mycobacterium sp.]|uniref:hypothetical protein n=1 Tax=Mycobacterium sp. TaxID=1785 RepID=UPI0028B91C02|nr:hypothetical protein [Mycobacterium sp.]
MLPKSIAAAVGAVAGGAPGRPVGAAAGATVEELLKQVNTRLWGWVVEGLALRSAQKLLSRSVMAEQELRGRLGSRLEQIWMTGRA